ncbi:MAG: fibronectin type III domain-containing protein [Bacteroidales bacterium]|nr:fibronectin type III domain-containing protein [Bacteroidales bacterium]
MLFFSSVGKVAAQGNYSITVPEGASVYVGSKGAAHYVPFTEKTPVDISPSGDGKTVYRYSVSGKHNYRVSMPGKLTHTGVFTPSSSATGLEITLADLNSRSPKELDRNVLSNGGRNMADVFLNINERGYLRLAGGNTYRLLHLRNWQAIDSDVNNYFLEPDYHYRVVNENGAEDNSVVTVSPAGLITAVGAGTAIVLVAYDAFICSSANVGPFFGALWTENTGVFVVSVDAPETGIEPNMRISEIWNAEGSAKVADTFIDAEIDVLYYEASTGGFDYTFSPSNVTSVTLARPAIVETDGAASLHYGGFSDEGVTANDDGSYTVRLVHGRNIVKLSAPTGSEYQVISAKPVTCAVSNATRPGQRFQPGDEVSVTFNTLYHPCNKLAGIYNMSAGIQYTGFNTDFPLILSPHQYTFASGAQTYSVTIPANYDREDFELVNGVLKINGYGSVYGAHRRILPNEGALPNLNASVHAAYFGILPSLYFRLTDKPGKPANLKTERTATSITLSWDASIDDESIARYNIYLNGAKTDETTQTDFMLAGLTPETGYTVGVEAVDNKGNLSDRTSARVTTLAEGTPSKPSGLRLAGRDGSAVTLAWNAPTDGIAVTYNVYVNLSPEKSGIDGLTCTLALAESYTHSIRLEAVDKVTNKKSEQSNALLVSIPDVTPPTMPGNLAATPAGTGVILSWTASVDNDKSTGVTGYNVYVNGENTATVTQPEYAVTGLTVGTEYTFAVEATDAAGNRSEKAQITASIQPTGTETFEEDAARVYHVAGTLRVLHLEGYVCRVYTLTGQQTHVFRTLSPDETHAVHLPEGIYIFTAEKENQRKIFKFAVSK